jgi:DNA invertase Pin-like site-specific DNA recombinase
MLESNLQKMGIEDYLNATKGLHRGKGYKDFVRMYEDGKPRIQIAIAFGVSRPTVYDWIKLYDKITAKESK